MLPDVNLTAYAGVWYHIGATAVQKALSEVDTVCISGRYSLISSGPNTNAIRIRLDSYNTNSGDYSALVGLLTVNGRSLSLQLPGTPVSDYRIIYLSGDPKDKYKTAMTYSCSPGSTQAINILSRKPTLDEDESIAELVAYAQSLGITLEANNQIVLTAQDAITCGRNDD
jgi:apolipoprotein D and lipocalin family protein